MLYHGSPLEWTQLIVAVSGTGLNGWSWYRARKDYHWVKSTRSSSTFALLVSEGTYTAEITNLLMAFATLWAGITAIADPPPPGEFTSTAYWKLMSLITISVLLALQGFRAGWYRRKLLGYDRRAAETRRIGPDRRKGGDRRRAGYNSLGH